MTDEELSPIDNLGRLSVGLLRVAMVVCLGIFQPGCASSVRTTLTAVGFRPGQVICAPPVEVRLRVGESAVTVVNAVDPSNDTGIAVLPGERYDFEGPGSQRWYDAGNAVTLGGRNRRVIAATCPSKRRLGLPWSAKWARSVIKLS